MQRQLFRLIIPAHSHKNVFSVVSSQMTSLGPILVATSVNKSFWDLDVEVIDENNYRGPRNEKKLPDHEYLQKERPAQFVGFYCGLTSTMPRVFELAAFYKNQGAATIAGGDHAAHLAEESLKNNIDIVVRGEGELVITEIIKALKEETILEKIGGISWRKNGKIFHNKPEKIELESLDNLVRPDFGLLRWANKISIYPINRTRGCSHRCEFCTVKTKPRWACADKALSDVFWLVQTRKAKNFFIVDDRLNEDAQGTRAFFESIIQAKKEGFLPKKIAFTVQIRLEAAREPEFLKLMHRAGVKAVCIGYESPIAQELNSMKKGLRPQDMVNYTKIFKKIGFWIHAMFIFGYPAKEGQISLSVRERVAEFKKFIRRSKPDTLQVMITIPLPGTELYERLNKQGRVYPRELVGWENYDGGHLCFKPDPPMNARQVQEGAIEIMKWFYSSWNFWKIPLLIFVFPFVVSFTFSSSGWQYWRRHWRNSILGYAGHLIIKQWLKLTKKSRWLERLALAQRKTVAGQA